MSTVHHRPTRGGGGGEVRQKLGKSALDELNIIRDWWGYGNAAVESQSK
jgi:hypothetical protein